MLVELKDLEKIVSKVAINKDDKIIKEPNQDHKNHFLITKNLNIFFLKVIY